MPELKMTLGSDSETALPAVYRSRISLDDLAEVFGDIEQCAELISVSLRGVRGSNRQEGNVTLSNALAMARDGSVGAIQVRYRHRDELWIDTISIEPPDACVLIRTRLDT